MGACPFFFGANKNMLNKRADKLELLRIAEAVALEKSKHVEDVIKNNFDLSPRGIREMLSLNKPIYECTSAYGHFGREPKTNGSFSWEKTDKKDVFNK